MDDLGADGVEVDVLRGGVEGPAIGLVGTESLSDSSSSSETYRYAGMLVAGGGTSMGVDVKIGLVFQCNYQVVSDALKTLYFVL